MKVSLSLLLLALALVPTRAGNAIYDAVQGKLVALDGRVLDELTDPARAQNARFYALYFASGADEASQAFTPELARFYQYITQRYRDFELIYVSRDPNEAEMEEFMLQEPLLCPAVAFDDARLIGKINAYAGPNLPSLVFVNANGKVLATSYRNDRYVGPGPVLNFIANYLKKKGNLVQR